MRWALRSGNRSTKEVSLSIPAPHLDKEDLHPSPVRTRYKLKNTLN